jgi:hypothetical protein
MTLFWSVTGRTTPRLRLIEVGPVAFLIVLCLAVTVAALEEPRTAGHVYQLTGGKTPIKTALSKALG